MRAREFVTEGTVKTPNFGRRSPYYRNPDIEVPMFDPVAKRVWNLAYSQHNPQEPFDSFELEPAGRTGSHIIGIHNGRKYRISTAHTQLAQVLVAAYQRGGFTDVPLQKVRLEPSQPKGTPTTKPHLTLVK